MPRSMRLSARQAGRNTEGAWRETWRQGRTALGGLRHPPMQSVVQSFQKIPEALHSKGSGIFFDWTVNLVFEFTVQSFQSKKEARPALIDRAGGLVV